MSKLGGLRTRLTALHTQSLCAAVPLVNGYGRTSCGLLFYEPGGAHRQARYAITSLAGNVAWQFLGGGIAATTSFDVFNAATFANPFGVRIQSRSELRILALGVVKSGAYIQCVQAWNGTARPGMGLISTVDAGIAYCGVEADHAAAGQENAEFSAPGVGLIRQAHGQVTLNIALEIRPDDQFVQGWSDDGISGARNSFFGGAGITNFKWPAYCVLIGQNNQNGFQESMGWGDVVVCKEHDIFLHGPPNGSVRISVNGVVQAFPGPIGYANLSAAGLYRYWPIAGVWFPSIIRYEFFTAPALGGVLAADLTIPQSWGGDRVGLP